MQSYCHICDEQKEYAVTEEEQENIINKVALKTKVKLPRCLNCGVEIYIPEIGDENLERIRRTYGLG